MSTERTATWDAPSVREAEERAYVTGLDGEPATAVELPLDLRVTVGRDFGCGIRLDHKSVSRCHASVRYAGGTTFELVDQQSRNGTFVGGARITGAVTIESGTEVRIGDRRLLLVVRPGARRGADVDEPIACDPRMREVVARCERVARTLSNVLLVAETGAGKEVLARFTHTRSPRASGPFVAVNCGAIPESLAAAELFGHERGAFSGAEERRAGWFEAASGGTLFLDEVGELGPSTQTTLLRILQERSVRRLGATSSIDVDVRVIAATHRPLDELVKEGRFRADLLYRLDVVRIDIPPLRERPLDVEALALDLVARLSPGRRVRLSEAALGALCTHPWPGNVRQLRNVLERTLALCEREIIGPSDLVELHDPAPAGTAPWALDGRVADFEREALVAALEACGGNQTAAARRLGISRRAIIYRMRKHGLR